MKNLKSSHKGSFKDNQLILPHKRSAFEPQKTIIANSKQRRSVSLQPSIVKKLKDGQLQRQSTKGGDYKIQIMDIDIEEAESLADVSSSSDEEGLDTCGGKYLQLGINRYFMKNNHNMEHTFLSTSLKIREKAVFSMPDPYNFSDDDDDY